ncbi:MAG: XRE family transcriptional regulator [Pseudomonadota bacterium]
MDLSEVNTGAKIRLYRKRKNISLSQLSALTGIAASNLSSIELNKTSPTLSTLAKIADAFGAKVGEFLNGILYRKTVICEQNGKNPSQKHNHDVTEYLLTSDAILNKLEAKILIFAPNTGPISVSPENTDRFAFILKGMIILVTEEDDIQLTEGQGVYMAPDSDASFANRSNTVVRMLVTYSRA